MVGGLHTIIVTSSRRRHKQTAWRGAKSGFAIVVVASVFSVVVASSKVTFFLHGHP